MIKKFFKLYEHFHSGIFLILIILSFSLVSCDNQELNSQVDSDKKIKSTTDSNNAGDTGFSNAEGTIKWSFYTGDYIGSSPAPAIGLDGTIYFCLYDISNCVLYALTPDGNKKWEFQAVGEYYGSPCIGEDGTIYFSAGGDFYAINPDGSLKWRFQTEGLKNLSPAIGLNGTIYLPSQGAIYSGADGLYAIRPDGSLKWKFSLTQAPDSPSIGQDGTIYFGCADGKFYALSPGATKRWEFDPEGKVRYSPAIGSDGTIYFSSSGGYFYALSPAGAEKWRYLIGETTSFGTVIGAYTANPIIGQDGTVYCGINPFTISSNHFFIAFNPDGNLKWSFNPGDNIKYSSAVDSNGTIYFGCDNGIFYDLDSDGTLKWEFSAGDMITSAPAISQDGTIYFNSLDGYFYALNTDSLGLADSPWPKYHYNSQNSGSVQSSEYYAPFGELEAPASHELHLGDEIEVFGWALSLAGILRVEIYIDDVYQGEAELGIERDDIFQLYPEYNNRQSGFKWTWNIQSVPRGKYILEVIAINALEMETSFERRDLFVFKW